MVNTNAFNYAMSICVLLNTIILGLNYYGMSEDYENALELANHLFSMLFGIELTLKL
jgi:hypothetical protein